MSSTGTWSDAVRIDGNDGEVREPHVGVDDRGYALVAWTWGLLGTTTTAFFSRRYESGAWGISRYVTLPPYDSIDFGKFALNRSGQAAFVWLERRDFKEWLMLRLMDMSGALGDESSVPMPSLFDAARSAVAMDDAGNMMLAWFDYNQARQLQMRARAYTPAGWGTIELLEGENQLMDGNYARPNLVMTRSGTAVLAWRKAGANGHSSVWAQVHSPGVGWRPGTLLESQGDDGSEPVLALSSTGLAAAMWCAGTRALASFSSLGP